LLPSQGARARERRLPDVPRADRAHAGRRRDHRPQPAQRPCPAHRAAPRAATAHDGLVRRLPPPREHDARRAGAARLRHLSPLSAVRRGARRRDLVRGQILTAAAELFRARGYRATTLAHLATSLGMSKATVYGHFRSKEDLLAAIFHRTM